MQLGFVSPPSNFAPVLKDCVSGFEFAIGQSIALSNARVRAVVAKAAGDVIEASTTSEEPAAPAITTMLSEAELLKKKAKKVEIRRKKLLRKRKLRKKGKWPPSKMAKLKNV